MTEYAPNTILRFYPTEGSQDHFSAVVKQNNSIFEVKSPNSERVKQVYESLTEWLASLPGSPSADKLSIDTNPKRRTKADGEKKKVKDKKAKPKKIIKPGKNMPRSTRWLIQIYRLMKEANAELLTNQAVVEAFNALYDCLAKYTADVSTWPSHNKYSGGIVIEHKQWDQWKGIPGRILSNVPNWTDIIADIIKTYTPLYELIKRDVVPHMERKAWAHKSKIMTGRYMREMERLEYKRQSIVTKYKSDMEWVERFIAETAKNLKTYQEPYKVTEFPPAVAEQAMP